MKINTINPYVTTMKLSRYNYYLTDTNVCYWFNGITLSYFKLSNELNKKMHDVLKKDINSLESISPGFFKKLKDNGFIIDDDIDELDIIRELNDKTVNSKDYFLVILPTLNCNFKCWYCVQDHIESKMTLPTISSIQNHLKLMVEKEKVSSLHIEWFGGEPFLYFDEVIKPISKFAIDLCKKNDIPFINSATSNGYFLGEETITSLEELYFRHFQITIDGTKEQHNKVKKDKSGNSSYDVTMGNINELLTRTDDINITLRINYDNKNLKEGILEQVNEIIQPGNRKKVHIAFRRVWQEKVDMGRSSTITKMTDAFVDAGYGIVRWDVDKNFISCYSDRKYYNAINYNGDIIKCTANDDLFNNQAPGKLQKDGTIKWNDVFLKNFYKKRFENKLCLKCKHLPLCMGECGRDYRDKKNDTTEVICHNSLDLSYDEIILNYCKINDK